MDPIGSIVPKKDSTFAMLLEGQRRGHRMHYAGPGSLAVVDGRATVRSAPVAVRDQPADAASGRAGRATIPVVSSAGHPGRLDGIR